MIWVEEATAVELAQSFESQFKPMCVDNEVKSIELKFVCHILKVEFSLKTNNLKAAALVVFEMRELTDAYPNDYLFFRERVELYEQKIYKKNG
jgi:hypothetical protein